MTKPDVTRAEATNVRVLLVSPFPPPPDGIGSHSRLLVRAWRAQGHDVRVATRRGPEATADGLDVRRVLGPRAATAGVLDGWAPHVVVVQFAVPALTFAWPSAWRLVAAARASGATVVTAFHEPVRELQSLRWLGRTVYRRVARHTDVPVGFSTSGVQALSRLGVDGAQLLPLGVPRLDSPEPSEVARVRQAYAVNEQTVLSLGFVHPDKGTDVLCAAAQSLAEAGTSVDLLVAGSVRRRQGAWRVFEVGDRRFDRRVRRIAASGYGIRFHGYVPDRDLAPLLHAVGAMVLPYRRITQSGVAGLALAAGLPVVTSDLEGLTEVLGPSAVVVPAGDTARLAEALHRLSTDSDLRGELRQASEARRSGADARSVACRLLELAGIAKPR